MRLTPLLPLPSHHRPFPPIRTKPLNRLTKACSPSILKPSHSQPERQSKPRPWMEISQCTNHPKGHVIPPLIYYAQYYIE